MPVVIPTHESAFQEHVQAAGCVTINLRIIKVNGRETHQFSLSTPSKSVTGRHVMLYSRTKPEPKMFSSLRALQTILAKLGFQVAEIPVQAGSWQCFLPDVSRGVSGA